MSTIQTYPWYSEILHKEELLQQGDFIFKCPIVQINSTNYISNQEIDAEIHDYDVIVMSQSCDLVPEKKINLALVCPFYPLSKYVISNPDCKNKEMQKKLHRGEIISAHLLNEYEFDDQNSDFLVVDFKSVQAIPLKLLKQITLTCEKRKRLLPPYREHLSQAFARFIMRVGLPTDIPKFYEHK